MSDIYKIPSIIGGVSNASGASWHIPSVRMNQINTDAIVDTALKLGGGVSRIGAIAGQEAYNNAIRDLDEFVNKSLLTRKGLEASDCSKLYQEKYNEILGKYEKDVPFFGRGRFGELMQTTYNGRMNQLENYSNDQIDRAENYALTTAMETDSAMAISNPSDDTPIARISMYQAEKLKKNGVYADDANVAEYEKKYNISRDGNLSEDERILQADKAASAARDEMMKAKAGVTDEQKRSYEQKQAYSDLLKARKNSVAQMQNSIDYILSGRVSKLLSEEKTESAKTLLSMYDPDGKNAYPYKLSRPAFDRMKKTFEAENNLISTQRTVDGITKEFFGGNVFVVGRDDFSLTSAKALDTVHKRFSGKEEERVVNSLKVRLSELQSANATMENSALYKTVNTAVSFTDRNQAENYLSRELRDKREDYKAAVMNNYRKLSGRADVKSSANISALDHLTMAIKDKQYTTGGGAVMSCRTSEEAYNIYVELGGNLSAENKIKINNMIKNSEFFASEEDYAAACAKNGVPYDLAGLRAHLALVGGGRAIPRNELDRLVNEYGMTQITNHNSVWLNTTSPLKDMYSNEVDIRMDSKTARKIYDRTRNAAISLRGTNRSLPRFMRSANPPEEDLRIFMKENNYWWNGENFQIENDAARIQRLSKK